MLFAVSDAVVRMMCPNDDGAMYVAFKSQWSLPRAEKQPTVSKISKQASLVVFARCAAIASHQIESVDLPVLARGACGWFAGDWSSYLGAFSELATVVVQFYSTGTGTYLPYLKLSWKDFPSAVRACLKMTTTEKWMMWISFCLGFWWVRR
jgi:hypothetical protein